MINIYLAGPLGFSEAGRVFHAERIVARIEQLGHAALDPWSDTHDIVAIHALPEGAARRTAWRELNMRIGRKNQDLIDSCDAVFAVLDGADVDSGAASEIGYAFGRGKPILGYRSDYRLSAENEGSLVNLQVEYFIRASGGTIIRTLDDLPAALASLRRAPQSS